MKLNELSLRDHGLFSRYLEKSSHELAVYSFTNTYIWNSLFGIKWSLIDKSLCIFFQDKIGAFLYLSPLCKDPDPDAVQSAFKYLDSINKNREISRIENVEAKDIAFYRSIGLVCRKKSVDYVCSLRDMAELRGDKFRHKRAAGNYFIKNYKYEYLPYTANDARACVRLYNEWAKARSLDNPDPFYRAMLEDSLKSLKVLLENHKELNCEGGVVKIGAKLKGFTFGFKLNRDTFCVLYEITDLCVKGLAQFIFRAFCRELEDYKYINIMDDSGLENLKKVKLSYRPVKLVPAYIVTR